MEHGATWLSTQGANHPGLYIGSKKWPGEIRTCQAIVEGQLLLHVPHRALISLEVAQTAAIAKKIAAQAMKLSEFGYLAAFLLEAKNMDHPHRAYAEALMLTPCAHPLLGGNAVLEALKGSRAYSILNEQRKNLIEDYRVLQTCWQESDIPKSEEFARMYCAVMMRSGIFKFGEQDMLTLIPLLDTPIHSVTPNAVFAPDASNGVMLLANRAIEAEEPISTCYGYQPNSILFANSGIFLDANPYDEIDIEFPAPSSSHPLHVILSKLGQIHEGWQILQLARNPESNAMYTVLSFIRLACLADVNALLRLLTSDAMVNRIPFISEENESAAWEILGTACERALKRYEISDMADQSTNDVRPTAILEGAQSVSKGEQAILKEYLEKCAKIASNRESTALTGD